MPLLFLASINIIYPCRLHLLEESRIIKPGMNLTRLKYIRKCEKLYANARKRKIFLIINFLPLKKISGGILLIALLATFFTSYLFFHSLAGFYLPFAVVRQKFCSHKYAFVFRTIMLCKTDRQFFAKKRNSISLLFKLTKTSHIFNNLESTNFEFFR